MIRPRMQVLSATAVVPSDNILRSPPEHFTHVVISRQPYYFKRPRKGTMPAGEFESGEKVLLISHDGGEFCRVADGRGLSAFTAFAELRPV